MSDDRRRNPRPGLVLDVDRSTPPVLFHHGEGFRMEKLPAGRSRILYPPEPLPGLKNPDRHIKDALENPLGDSPPLSALMKPGMKLTIAFDDISCINVQTWFLVLLGRLSVAWSMCLKSYIGKQRKWVYESHELCRQQMRHGAGIL